MPQSQIRTATQPPAEHRKRTPRLYKSGYIKVLVETAAAGYKPVFVGFNACFDWQFVNWYLESFAEGNPFGFAGIDIKSYFMGFSGCRWSETTSSQLPPEFRPDTPQTHNALDDAQAQALIFEKLLRARKPT